MSSTKTKTTKQLNITADQSAKLVKLAREIRPLYKNTDALVRTAQEKGREAIAEAILCGQKLNEAKAIVKHGEWEKWIKTTVKGCNADTCRRYMRLSKASHVTDLTDFTSLRQAYIEVGILDDQPIMRTDNERSSTNKASEHESSEVSGSGESPIIPPPLKMGYVAPVTIGRVARDTGAERIKRIRTMTVALESELNHLPKPHVAEARRIIGKLLAFSESTKRKKK